MRTALRIRRRAMGKIVSSPVSVLRTPQKDDVAATVDLEVLLYNTNPLGANPYTFWGTDEDGIEALIAGPQAASTTTYDLPDLKRFTSFRSEADTDDGTLGATGRTGINPGVPTNEDAEYSEQVAYSAVAQAVVDRYTTLTLTEADAIAAFVDGCEADNVWSLVKECFVLILSQDDFLTGMRGVAALVPVQGGSLPYTLARGTSLTLTASTHFRTTSAVDAFLSEPNQYAVGIYHISFTDADDASNTDYFGARSLLPEEGLLYHRWRGTDEDDYQTQFTSSTVIPRSTKVSRLTGGTIIGANLQDGNNLLIWPDGSAESLARAVQTPYPSVALQWNGRNNDGTTQSRRACEHAAWFVLEAPIITQADLLAFRLRLNTLITTLQA